MSIRLLFLLLSAASMVMVTSCQQKTTTYDTPTQDTAVQIDEQPAVEEPKDSLAEAEEFVEELVQTHNRVEAFNDFFFTFLNNKRFQADRVKFPLPISDDSGERTISSGKAFRSYFNWPDINEFCVLASSEEEIKDFQNDPDCKQVELQIINLPENMVRYFRFSRDAAEWQLDSAGEQAPSGDYADFLRFYNRFVTDSLFQQSSLAAQIEYRQTDYEEEAQDVEGTLEAYQWNTFRPELPHEQITNMVFGQRLEDMNQVVLIHCGIADGMMDVFTFSKKDGHWLLVGYNN